MEEHGLLRCHGLWGHQGPLPVASTSWGTKAFPLPMEMHQPST